jgi:hypothetical protein
MVISRARLTTTLAKSSPFKRLSVILCILLGSCSSGQTASDPKILQVLKAEQTADRIVIGMKYGDRLEYFDATDGNSVRKVSFPVQSQNPAVSLDLRAAGTVPTSSDGRWLASCQESNCAISEKLNQARHLQISRKDVLTPIYWSPDDRFVFLVRKGPTWRHPARCSLEDEWDVTVYEIATGLQGVVTTVCGGFPYGSLRWYKLTAD